MSARRRPGTGPFAVTDDRWRDPLDTHGSLFLRATLLSLLALTMATYTLGPLSHARWAIQDDHETAFFAGPRAGSPSPAFPGCSAKRTRATPGAWPDSV